MRSTVDFKTIKTNLIKLMLNIMKNFQRFIFSLVFLTLMACGETVSNSSDEAAIAMTTSGTAVAVSESVERTDSDQDGQASANETNTSAKKELMEESISAETEVTLSNPENIENPNTVKKKTTTPPKPKKNVEAQPDKFSTSIPSTTVEEPTAPKVEANTTPDPDVEIPVEKEQTPSTTSEMKEVSFNHNALNALLQQYVSSGGKVNYNGFKADEAKLDAYLKTLEENAVGSDWPRAKQMAYYINAYNAATIKLILENFPVKKITDLHGGKPWDVKWVKLGGKAYSLNAIENDILRPKYGDARIHFAVNCAAKSCPPLLNKAWTESNLERYLNQQTKSFINDASQNTLTANSVTISKIFDWYSKDFGDITDYLNKYSTTKINGDATVNYKEYNWALNN